MKTNETHNPSLVLIIYKEFPLFNNSEWLEYVTISGNNIISTSVNVLMLDDVVNISDIIKLDGEYKLVK